METSDVRKQLNLVIDRARKSAAERRTRSDAATKAYERFLTQTAIPLFRQVAGALKAANHPFSVFTPAGSVRLMSDRTPEDFIEIALDTAGSQPVVMGHVSRARGRRIVESERPIAESDIEEISDEQVLAFILSEIDPFVER